MSNEARTGRLRDQAHKLRRQAVSVSHEGERARLLQRALAWDRAADRNARALPAEGFVHPPDPEQLRAWSLKAERLRLQASRLADPELKRVLLNSARWLERAVRRADHRAVHRADLH